MDEEPPVFLAYQPYKGPASIPHAPGEFFGAFFLGINVGGAVLLLLLARLLLPVAGIVPGTACSCAQGCVECIGRNSNT